MCGCAMTSCPPLQINVNYIRNWIYLLLTSFTHANSWFSSTCTLHQMLTWISVKGRCHCLLNKSHKVTHTHTHTQIYIHVPKTCRAKDTSIKLPCCIKLVFHIISWGRCMVKQPSEFPDSYLTFSYGWACSLQ